MGSRGRDPKQNVPLFCCQATRLDPRASSLTISVLLTFNILTFIAGNGKRMSTVRRGDMTKGGGMQQPRGVPTFVVLLSFSNLNNADEASSEGRGVHVTPSQHVEMMQIACCC